MTSAEASSLALTLAALLVTVHGLGFVFEKLRQPKLIGEILAGALLGPALLGSFFPELSHNPMIILDFISQTGLMLLMFLAGSETRQLKLKENIKIIFWLISVGTALPFVTILMGANWGWLSIHSLMGSAQNEQATLLLLAIAVCVTSIPVLTRIFQDLKIIHTHFAGLVIGTAVLEDIILWGILAVAQVLASGKTGMSEILFHTLLNLSFMLAGLFLFPKVLTKFYSARANFIRRASPAAWPLFVMLAYVSMARLLDVNVIFAAFLAGFGVIGGRKAPVAELVSPSIESIATVARAFFIPLFFAMVGYRLKLGEGFNLGELTRFLLLSTTVSVAANFIASKLAGLKNLDAFNLAFTQNARGGPGIVLAGIAFESGLVTGSFYTTLVLTAILTSQMSAMWLKWVLKNNRLLLYK
jgi:Kef-type K+ transport system membrane component KefB